MLLLLEAVVVMRRIQLEELEEEQLLGLGLVEQAVEHKSKVVLQVV